MEQRYLELSPRPRAWPWTLVSVHPCNFTLAIHVPRGSSISNKFAGLQEVRDCGATMYSQVCLLFEQFSIE